MFWLRKKKIDFLSHLKIMHLYYVIVVVLSFSPGFFLKKKTIGILQSPPSVRHSVRPSFTLSPPNPFDEIQPNSVCELLIAKSIRKILNQTLYVFSQMKDIKHIRQDFYLVALVMPQGWELGELGVKSVCLSITLSPPKPIDEIQPNLVCELLT